MPIREYVCMKCGLEFESIDLGRGGDQESAPAVCPNCGSRKVEKLFSRFSSPGDGSSSSCGNRPSPGRFR